MTTTTTTTVPSPILQPTQDMILENDSKIAAAADDEDIPDLGELPIKEQNHDDGDPEEIPDLGKLPIKEEDSTTTKQPSLISTQKTSTASKQKSSDIGDTTYSSRINIQNTRDKEVETRRTTEDPMSTSTTSMDERDKQNEDGIGDNTTYTHKKETSTASTKTTTRSPLKENMIHSIDVDVTTESITTNAISTQDTSTTSIKERVIEYCNPTSIIRKSLLHQPQTSTKDNVTCIPINTTEEGCNLAEKLYSPDTLMSKCEPSDPVVDICHIVEPRQSKQHQHHQFKCSISDCTEKYSKNKVVVHMVNDQTGKLKRHKRSFRKAQDLENALPRISSKTLSEGYGFLILQCIDDNDGVGGKQPRVPEVAQLLILPPLFSEKRNRGAGEEQKRQQRQQQQQQNQQEDPINLNIILLDSASRSHFYRSLPQTIKTFEKINRESETTNAAEVYIHLQA